MSFVLGFVTQDVDPDNRPAKDLAQTSLFADNRLSGRRLRASAVRRDQSRQWHVLVETGACWGRCHIKHNCRSGPDRFSLTRTRQVDGSACSPEIGRPGEGSAARASARPGAKGRSEGAARQTEAGTVRARRARSRQPDTDCRAYRNRGRISDDRRGEEVRC